MKKSNRKGFTIVELVIVIAVIAILAAVLIPTFSNLIKKANESSDVQAVRQMNTILAAENAFLGGITINDAVKALEEAGFNGDKYVPLVAGTYFFYDQNTKQIVYVDGEFNVIYPKGAEIEGHALFSLSGETPKEDYPAPVINETENTATFTISTAAQFAQLAADFKALTDGEEPAGLAGFDKKDMGNNIIGVTGKDIVIVLENDIDMKGAFFNLNLDGISFTLKSGREDGENVVISGVVNNSGFALSNANDDKQLSEYGAGFVGYVNNCDVTFEGITFKNCHFGNTKVKSSAVFVGQLTNTSSLTLKNTKVEDCTVDGLKGVAVYVGHAASEGTQHVVFEGTNTVSRCELNAFDTTNTGMVGTIIGRISSAANRTVSGPAPTFENITIISAGVPVDATVRSIINYNGTVPSENIVEYKGTTWSRN